MDYTTPAANKLTRKRQAQAQAEQAIMRYRGLESCTIFGRWTIGELATIATRYNLAYAYRRETGDQVGAELIAINGWTIEQVRDRFDDEPQGETK